MASPSRKVMAAAIAASVAAHTIAITPDSIRYPARRIMMLGSGLIEQYAQYQIRAERVKLIEGARAALKEGKLELGGFILKGNYLDARERGEEPDLGNAVLRYNYFLGALRSAAADGKGPQESMPEVLGSKMEYYGIPGGTVLDAVLEGGGSCEQLSPLIASLIYDAGFQNKSFMRVYGQNSSGVGHIAPVFVDGGKEYDLLSGTPSDGKGTLVKAEDIVEAYAMAHGLALKTVSPSAQVGGSGGSVGQALPGNAEMMPEGKDSGLTFPPGKDSYESGVPFFAKKAIGRFQEQGGVQAPAPNEGTGGLEMGGGQLDSGTGGGENPLLIHDMDMKSHLNPQNLARMPGGVGPGIIRVHLEVGMADDALDNLGRMIDTERKRMANEQGWRRVLAMGRLAGLYSEAYWQFKLVNKEKMANAAAKERDRLVSQAIPPLKESESARRNANPAAASAIDDPFNDMGWWPLAYLGQAGEDAFFRLVDEQYGGTDYTCLAYFLAKEHSREKALGVIEKRSLGAQAELFGLLGESEIEGPQEFLRAYRVYRKAMDWFSTHMRDSTAEEGEMASQPEMEKLSWISIGKSASTSSIRARFTGVERGAAILEISREAWHSSSIHQRIKIRPGEIKEIQNPWDGIAEPDGPHVFFKVFSFPPCNKDYSDAKILLGMATGGKGADLGFRRNVMGFPRNVDGESAPGESGIGGMFEDLVREVSDDCDRENLGSAWKIAIVNACATSGKIVNYSGGGGRLMSDYVTWSRHTLAERKTHGIVAIAGMDDVSSELRIIEARQLGR